MILVFTLSATTAECPSSPLLPNLNESEQWNEGHIGHETEVSSKIYQHASINILKIFWTYRFQHNAYNIIIYIYCEQMNPCSGCSYQLRYLLCQYCRTLMVHGKRSSDPFPRTRTWASTASRCTVKHVHHKCPSVQFPLTPPMPVVFFEPRTRERELWIRLFLLLELRLCT